MRTVAAIAFIAAIGGPANVLGACLAAGEASAARYAAGIWCGMGPKGTVTWETRMVGDDAIESREIERNCVRENKAWILYKLDPAAFSACVLRAVRDEPRSAGTPSQGIVERVISSDEVQFLATTEGGSERLVGDDEKLLIRRCRK